MSNQASVDAIIKTLDEDRERRWSQKDLAEHVLSKYDTGFKATSHIEYAIRTLVAVGRIGGTMTRDGQTAMSIRWMPPSDEASMAALRQAKQAIETATAEKKALEAKAAQLQAQLDKKDPDEVKHLRLEIDLAKQRIEQAEKQANEAAAERAAAGKRVVEVSKECDALREALKDHSKSVVEIRTYDKATGEMKSSKDLYHKQFKRILKLAYARKNIFIYGPTGCGKSYVCRQVADALGLPFAFVSCTSGMSEGQLAGRLLPTGENGKFEYIVSEFIKCYEEGGVFLLDEIDACDANVLLVINAALDNEGAFPVPNRPEKPYAVKHPDFICIAAANTVGQGASRMYSGRNKLDAATLERFAIGKVHMDYDPRVEETVCPDKTLLSTLHKWRQGINENGLERAVSTRFIANAYHMMNLPDEAMRFDMDDITDAFFQGWREDEAYKVKNFRGSSK